MTEGKEKELDKAFDSWMIAKRVRHRSARATTTNSGETPKMTIVDNQGTQGGKHDNLEGDHVSLEGINGGVTKESLAAEIVAQKASSKNSKVITGKQKNH